MTLNEYQRATESTMVYTWPESVSRTTYCALGLAGEAGEVANEAKKLWRDDGGQTTPERAAKIAIELGDVLWYLARLADELGYSLEAIARQNLDKLTARHGARVGW
jgi:NTP pyrophosphatase (non-canonical NTP hydrolase)